ncbi:hypothetical protein [Clostridium sp. D33t1_170424_F3]|uniref:hypothetical protein n=1 Tax=Clostridium sp. D33t1_170424_F3 TaxID=2787099 RepID=UPI0018A99865|nr:hypothetical protein [Clostridium sp. D33t1_170424_F3]
MAVDPDSNAPRRAAHDVPMRITRCTPECAFVCPCFYPYPWFVGATGPQGPTGATGPAGPGTALGGLQYQLTGGARRILAPGQAVPFDTPIQTDSTEISYDAGTGAFTLSAAGRYYISWWVSTDGSARSADLWFSLDLNGADHSIGAAPVVTGQISGSSLVKAETAPAFLTLRNATQTDIALCAAPAQANIVILRIS